MLCEERLGPLLPGLVPLLLQIDGTVVHGGPVTFRARDARTGLTLWAEQLEAESKPEVVRFLRAFRGRYGVPVLILRDLSATLREASAEVFPEVPQQEDHWHFLTDLGPLLLVDYEPLRHGLLAGEALARLALWSRGLPREGTPLEELERVWVRLALEWIDSAREHPGGFPWHLPYLGVVRRMARVVRWCEHLLVAHRHRQIPVSPEVVELRRRVAALLDREGVRLPYGRLEREVALWMEIRGAMRAERTRRSAGDLAPLGAAEVAEVQRTIEAAGGRFALYGEWAEGIWEKVRERFEAHRSYLWVVVPGLETVVRSTVALERAHREDRRGVRHRTGQSATGPEMGRLGSLLAFWSNARCRRFVEEGLAGVNLWEAFARQDPREVRRRLHALPREGHRPKVGVPAEKRQERLEAWVQLLEGASPLEVGLKEWAASVGGPITPQEAPDL
ncbi:MAG: hypothetical protein WBS16_07790 [Thermoplasmata archaeon]